MFNANIDCAYRFIYTEVTRDLCNGVNEAQEFEHVVSAALCVA